jgi:hypothetical protein
MDLFDQALAEVSTTEGLRYVLRRNPARAQEIQESREDKLKVLKKESARQNQYLKEHPRATVEVATRKIKARSERLKMSAWVLISTECVKQSETLPC